MCCSEWLAPSAVKAGSSAKGYADSCASEQGSTACSKGPALEAKAVGASGAAPALTLKDMFLQRTSLHLPQEPEKSLFLSEAAATSQPAFTEHSGADRATLATGVHEATPATPIVEAGKGGGKSPGNDSGTHLCQPSHQDSRSRRSRSGLSCGHATDGV